MMASYQASVVPVPLWNTAHMGQDFTTHCTVISRTSPNKDFFGTMMKVERGWRESFHPFILLSKRGPF
jgi:hypothetical protein